MAQPALPLELERNIFKLAVTDQTMITTLTLVAWRVNAWIGPLRYRVRVIERGAALDALCLRMAQRPEDAALTLFLATTARSNELSSVARLARAFPNLVDLGLWGLPVSPLDMQALHALTHLRRLSLNPRYALARDVAEARPAFAPLTRLTHLEIFGDLAEWMVPALAVAFPGLTHMSFVELSFPGLMQAVLQAQKTLRVFVYVYLAYKNGPHPWESPEEVANSLGVKDPRLAVVRIIGRGQRTMLPAEARKGRWRKGQMGIHNAETRSHPKIARRRMDEPKLSVKVKSAHPSPYQSILTAVGSMLPT
ncbi:hypothetical protein MIND_00584700 [Mycena indigotica]|uniref:Uncharacterized protein n=1 Tax=Mycena indigotica TaxID=2126181 RepID=A0A8H6W2U6_9AGAR|nr:uncharacterized protein MIND_00584700 [Mycena indigotica]KAF7303554.1 hypothetical protein MIND_00584700 [Mycena indigotica]